MRRSLPPPTKSSCRFRHNQAHWLGQCFPNLIPPKLRPLGEGQLVLGIQHTTRNIDQQRSLPVGPLERIQITSLRSEARNQQGHIRHAWQHLNRGIGQPEHQTNLRTGFRHVGHQLEHMAVAHRLKLDVHRPWIRGHTEQVDPFVGVLQKGFQGVPPHVGIQGHRVRTEPVKAGLRVVALRRANIPTLHVQHGGNVGGDCLHDPLQHPHALPPQRLKVGGIRLERGRVGSGLLNHLQDPALRGLARILRTDVESHAEV